MVKLIEMVTGVKNHRREVHRNLAFKLLPVSKSAKHDFAPGPTFPLDSWPNLRYT